MAHPRTAKRQLGGRRPLLLALVYGVFLVLVGVTASGLVAVAGAHINSATLEAVVARDHSLVELFVAGRLHARFAVRIEIVGERGHFREELHDVHDGQVRSGLGGE